MKLGILLTTYRKSNGDTHDHLKRALESVKNQKHQDYVVFLIGDDYDDNDEFVELSKIIDDDKLVKLNLPVAVERIKYRGKELWTTGGVNAANVGIDLAADRGIYHMCHLDHDDWYGENHLQLISDIIEKTGANFVTTRCGTGWPAIVSTEYCMKYRPLPSKVFRVTQCVNYRYYGFKVRNMIEEVGKVYAADADLLARINEHMINNNEWGYLINESTCGRGPGQSVMRDPNLK